MRKDSCSADARLRFFENEKVCCKLTAASAIQKGLLHVSFGAVGSRCRYALKNALLYRIALHELKKFAFFANQKFSIYRKLYALPSKASRFHNQNTACLNNFLLSAKTAFLRTKSLFFAQIFPYSHPKQSFSALSSLFQPPLTYCPQKFPIFTNQKPFFRTNLSLFPPKITLFCPPPPLPTTLNLLFAKNTAVLLLFALILCCKAGASHRFKSLPAIPGKLLFSAFAGYLMNAGHFRKNTVSTGDLNRPRSPEVRKPLACFLVTFCTMQKVTTRSLSGTSEVTQTSNQHTAAAASYRNN